MNWSINLARRQREPEIMDDPGLDPPRHRAALRGLARLNRWSASLRIVWSGVRPLVLAAGRQPLRVLDVATGGGDLPIGLWKRARRCGVPLEIHACDASPHALDYARQNAAQAGANVTFLLLDALRDEFPPDYDIVVSSLFLHHLDEPDAVLLLKKMAGAARHCVLVNDLRRDGLGLLLACAGSRLLTTSDVVHTDAVRSVRAAFAPAEVDALAVRAGLKGVRVEDRWPRRFLLTWRR